MTLKIFSWIQFKSKLLFFINSDIIIKKNFITDNIFNIKQLNIAIFLIFFI